MSTATTTTPDGLWRALNNATPDERETLLASLLDAATTVGLLARGEASDGYHTHRELYEYRLLYNAAAFNAWHLAGTVPVVKSWRHHDGEECFGGGWFIVVAALPSGQVSNHYRAEHWDLFAIPEVALPPAYDGHDPAEAARRLRESLSA